MAGGAGQPAPAGRRGFTAGRAPAHEEAWPAAHQRSIEGPEGDQAQVRCSRYVLCWKWQQHLRQVDVVRAEEGFPLAAPHESPMHSLQIYQACLAPSDVQCACRQLRRKRQRQMELQVLGVLMVRLACWQTWRCCKGRTMLATLQRRGMAQSGGSLLKTRREMVGQS